MSNPGDDEVISRRSAWLLPMGVVLVVLALSALLLLFYLAPRGQSLFHEQVTPTSRKDIVALTMHGQKFFIPANYLEFESARQGGERREISLYAILPDLTGWSNWQAEAFADNSADASAVFITIRDEKDDLSENDRLKRIYMGYVKSPVGAPGPFGLTQYEFQADSGYHDEDLYVGEISTGLVVLRCVRLSAEVPSPGCLRDMQIAKGVALTYRFKRSHLSEWREIGEGMNKLLVSFRQRPPK
jgi:hypothetical protein